MQRRKQRNRIIFHQLHADTPCDIGKTEACYGGRSQFSRDEKLFQTRMARHKRTLRPELKPFFDVRDSIVLGEGLLLKGERVVVPSALRKEMKEILHSAHLSHDSMMRRARNIVFWPGINNELRQMAASCDACQRSKPKNQKEPLHQHDEGKTPSEKVGLDFCEFGDRQYLIVVDYFSNFIEVEHMTSTATAHTISKLKQLFARYGIPKTIVSDNGPQFTAEKFQQFAKRWNILHKTSSPGHPQSNGRAEAAVKIIKTLMKRATNAETDPYEGLLELRNTPRQDVGLSPAQIMFGRSTRSMLPSRPEQRKLADQTFQDRREHRRSSSKKYFDRLPPPPPKLSMGQ
ncbi:Pol polyprotein [Elysia marginata]|uniref:Pol polyprotein n=1 Tax=Elysia marginata TaxID=1093978 RepID=A0AAV4JEL0_9GAST|nr:Pol polyprotein [Elysia marginata]